MISCFFCQNSASDYLESLVPSFRRVEIESHLAHCNDCRSYFDKLKHQLRQTVDLKNQMIGDAHYEQFKKLPAPGNLVSHRRKQILLKRSAATLGLLLIASIFSLKYFQWLETGIEDTPSFVRYNPLLHGAQEIIEEQASWIYFRDNRESPSWEESGPSTEEFEKMFSSSSKKATSEPTSTRKPIASPNTSTSDNEP